MLSLGEFLAFSIQMSNRFGISGLDLGNDLQRVFYFAFYYSDVQLVWHLRTQASFVFGESF